MSEGKEHSPFKTNGGLDNQEYSNLVTKPYVLRSYEVGLLYDNNSFYLFFKLRSETKIFPKGY
jgi:hypothetical protein